MAEAQVHFRHREIAVNRDAMLAIKAGCEFSDLEAEVSALHRRKALKYSQSCHVLRENGRFGFLPRSKSGSLPTCSFFGLSCCLTTVYICTISQCSANRDVGIRGKEHVDSGGGAYSTA